MRFHVVSLPHTQTTEAYGQCAYTQKVVKFCNMMHDLGHEVYLYASEENTARVTKHIVCITKKEQEHFLQDQPWYPDQYYKIPYRDDFFIWEFFNKRVLAQLHKNTQKGDFVLQTAGKSQKAITDAFPYCTVEYAVGYEGIYSRYRVFETNAWMHHVYGLKRIRLGSPFDTVIFNYYNVEDFMPGHHDGDYLLYMSRPVKSKGLFTAIEVARRSKKKLIIAGAEDPKINEPFVSWVGYADSKKRSMLMGKATALLAPTHVIEPFGGVVAEAQLCGTPVITTHWGAFTETVEDKKTGFLCRTSNEMAYAVTQLETLSTYYICERARILFDMRTIAKQYEEYFEFISPYIRMI